MPLEIGLLKKTQKTHTQKKKAKQEKKRTKVAFSLGYPNSYFYNKRCNMLL